jgi:hypothetical protein
MAHKDHYTAGQALHRKLSNTGSNNGDDYIFVTLDSGANTHYTNYTNAPKRARGYIYTCAVPHLHRQYANTTPARHSPAGITRTADVLDPLHEIAAYSYSAPRHNFNTTLITEKLDKKSGEGVHVRGHVPLDRITIKW